MHLSDKQGQSALLETLAFPFCFTNVGEKEEMQDIRRHFKRQERLCSIEKNQTHKILNPCDFYSVPVVYVWVDYKGEIFLPLFFLRVR